MASSTQCAYKVNGDGAVAGVTRIDGCPGVPLGPHKTPADAMANASNDRRGRGRIRKEAAFFLPRRSPPAEGEGRAAGEKECQNKGSEDEEARS